MEITSYENREILYGIPIPEIRTCLTLPDSQQLSAGGSFGSMLFQEIRFQDFSVHLSHYFIRETSGFLTRADQSILELHICLQRGVEYQLEGIGSVRMPEWSFNLTYVPHVVNRVLFTGSQHLTTFDIHFSREYLERMSPHFPGLSRFLDRTPRESGITLSPFFQSASPGMIRVIHDFVHCEFQQGMRKVYLEGKVWEILILALEKADRNPQEALMELKPYDRDRIEEARQILIREMEEPGTTQELARRVGINEFKLKNGFKQLYGAPIFTYLLEQKMKLAQDLLLETDLSVYEISFRTGFKSISNFSAAFKKYFGYTPTLARKK